MKLRFGPGLQDQLRKAKAWVGDSANDVMRKAIRKWDRLGRPDLAAVEAGSTYGGAVVTVDAPAGMDDAEARRLLAWFFSQAHLRPPRYRFTPTLVEGKDYEVVGEGAS